MNMKFSTTKRVLSEALSITGRAVGSKNIMPILDYYKFEIKQDSLEITGSNMEVFLKTKIEISSEIPHLLVCVPAARLQSIIKDLPEQPLEFEIGEKKLPPKPGETIAFTVRTLTIKAGKGVYSMTLENGEDFPEITNVGSDIQFAVPSSEIQKAIDRSLFAVMGDASGNPLCGVLLSINKSSATYVGCDGQIMGNYTHAIESEKQADYIIPAKVLQVLQGLPMDEALKIGIDSKSMKIQINDDTLMEFVLIDDRYPNINAVIPTNQDKVLSVNRNEFLGALKRVSNFASQINHTVKIDLSQSAIMLTAKNEDFGEDANEEIACGYDGPEFSIACNVKKLVAAIGKTVSEDIFLYMSEFRRPVLIRETNEFTDPKENIFMVMPVVSI